RALHEKEERSLTRAKFFVIVLICSFCWYAVPGYLFPTITTISWVCWAFPKSVTAQQLGSGLSGLGFGALTLDWSAVSSFLGNPLVCPFFAIVNVFVGYFPVIFVVVPVAYWGFDLFGGRRFPIFSSGLFTSQGRRYNISAIVNGEFEIDVAAYEEQGKLYISTFFALIYGVGFASVASTLTHVGLFHGREIYETYRDSSKGKVDIHTRLMRRYEDIPCWWFYAVAGATLGVSLTMCFVMKSEIHFPWWGLILASAIAFVFTLPVSIITATTNQTVPLGLFSEYMMGLINPGKPIANACFRVYAYATLSQAVSFLSDFKLGHYMKIPPKSMFIVQTLGTILAGAVNMVVAWWLLTSIENICDTALLPPGSIWTCPYDRIFYADTVIWGLIGPRRTFGELGNYDPINWFFLAGASGPVAVWLLHRAFPKQSWIPLINLPVLLGSSYFMFPAAPLNYNAWIVIGTAFNFFVFRYRKDWWKRYNYILAAALDAGVAFMSVLIYFSLGKWNVGIDWWGSGGDHCDLATCPTAKGIQVDGCPIY
ncbi:hypothetical protein M569_08909, partial [Genlisea aurea]